jgi:hypothetical protein
VNGPEIVVLSLATLWLIIAADVIGYPLVAGRIKVGLDPVSRDDEPRAFWKAYVLSTALFLGVSIAAGFFAHWILLSKP